MSICNLIKKLTGGVLCLALPVLAIDVLTPSGERVAMDSLRVRNGMVCLPKDTLQCYSSLPVAPSPWRLAIEWNATALEIERFQNSVLIRQEYDRNGIDPYVGIRSIRKDTVLKGNSWGGEIQAGMNWESSSWIGDVVISASKTIEDDTLIFMRTYQATFMPQNNGDVYVAWGTASLQQSRWIISRGFLFTLGATFLKTQGNWDFDISPSIYLQVFQETTPTAQSASVVECENVASSNASNIRCYEDFEGNVLQPLNPFKGALGYQFYGVGSESVWNSPNQWWMPSFSMENGYTIHSIWRLFYKGEISLKTWFKKFRWSNANIGADVPDASGDLALFRDRETGADYLLKLDGTSEFQLYRKDAAIRQDLILYSAMGVDYKASTNHNLNFQIFAIRSESNIYQKHLGGDYFEAGIALNWKGTW